MSEEASKKTFASKYQNKGEYQKPQHSSYKMNYGPSANGIYGHTAPHMYNPMAVHVQKGQAENTVNESSMSSGNFSATQPQVSHQPVVKTANTHTDALQRKLELVAKIAQKNAAAKKAKEEEAAAAAKKAEEEAAAAKKAEEEAAAAAKKAEEEATAAKKAEEEAASKATEAPVEETTEAVPAEGSKRLPSQTKSFASRFAQSFQENKKSNSFNNNSPNGLGYPPLVPEPGIPVSVWLDHMKNIPDDESKGRVYTFEDIFELSQYKVVRDEAWHKKLGENRLFQLPYKKHSDKKKSSYNNDSKRGDNRKNDSKRNKSKRNGDKYGNKYDNNYSKVPSKGLGLANSEEEAAARKKAEEEEAERLANIPKITTSEKGWKSKKKSQAQVVNIVTESGEEILSPDETEKQLKSLLNKLTAENYASVSVKIINIMNQSRFKEDKLKSITKTIEMTIFKGCDESQWGKIYARLIGDCMKNIDPGCLPLFKEYYIKAEKYKRYDKEEEWEEQGIPKSEWPPFDAAKETEDFAPHVPINYFLDIEMLKYDITGDSSEDIWNVKEGEEEETVEMMSDEYYKAIGKKRRYLGLYRIIGHLYNINALLFDFINREFISLVRNIAEASKKGVVKDDVIEALLEFVTTISAKYTEYCKASGIANSLDVILTLGNTLFTDKKISSRMAFKFEEYSNQRLTNPSGTQDNEVKSLEEVRIEAMREIQRKKREEKQKVQDFRNNSRNNKSSRNGRGNDRGFGSNRNQSFKNNNSNNNGNWNTSGHSNNGSKNDSKTFVRSSSKKAEEPPKQSIKNAFEMLSNDSD